MIRRPILAVGAAPAVGLVLLVALAYLPALRASYIWDDRQYVVENATLRDAEGLRRIWLVPRASPQYYPVVFSAFWLEYHLWGLDPLGYHAVNVALHGLNAVLVWRVLGRLGLPGAWLAAAIFGLHPVHVESVAWIAERKNVLSGLFSLSAVLAYWRFAPVEESSPRAAAMRWGWYAAAWLLFLAALGSKSVACSLPAVLLLIAWWKRGRVTGRDVIPLIPFFLAGAAASAVTVAMEAFHVGALGPEWSLSWFDRCRIAGRALWFYAGKLACPIGLCFIYPRWRLDAWAWWQDAYPIGFVAVVGALWWARGRVGRGPLAGVLFFAGTLLPALGFFKIYPQRYSFVADHFQYLASLGLIVPAAVLLARPTRVAWVRPAATGCLLIVLGTLTFTRTLAFQDDWTIWSDTLRKDPRSWMAHNNLGSLYLQRGLLEQARAHAVAALQLYPDYPEAHYNLGAILEEQGVLPAAEDHLRKAMARDSPVTWKTHYVLGLVFKKQGRYREAADEFREVLRLKPDYQGAWIQLESVATDRQP
jgi:tetratricopeptide (TPR) repeat protein